MKKRSETKRRPVYRWRDTVQEPITIAEFLADPDIPAIRAILERWDDKENRWKRTKRQSGTAGDWRVALFQPSGRLEKLYGRPFDSRSGEDLNTLLRMCQKWVDLDFGDHYLGLIATGLKIVHPPKTAAKLRSAAR